MPQGCREDASGMSNLGGVSLYTTTAQIKPKRRAGSGGIYCVGREGTFSHAPGPPAPCPIAKRTPAPLAGRAALAGWTGTGTELHRIFHRTYGKYPHAVFPAGTAFVQPVQVPAAKAGAGRRIAFLGHFNTPR